MGFVFGCFVAASFLAIPFLSESYKHLAIWTLVLSSSGLLFVTVILSIFRSEIWYGVIGKWSKVLRRADRPIGFWFVLAALTAMATAMMLLGLTGLQSYMSEGKKILQPPQDHLVGNHVNQNDKNKSETVLKVLVSANGIIDQVQILQSCGHPECDADAIDAVKKSSFKSLRQSGEHVDGWFVVKVTQRP